MSKKRTLTIAHLQVWDKNNKGDRAIVLATQELLRRRWRGCRIKNFPVTLLAKGRPADSRRLNACDVIVMGGGGLFYSYFLPYNLSFLNSLTKPLVIFGVGYIREVGAPALSAAAIASVVALVKKAVAVGVRDHNTKKFLVKAGVRAGHIKVIGDPAVLLSEVRPRKLSRSLTPLAHKPKKGPWRLGLNLNYSGWLGFGLWREDILNAYRAVVENWQKQFGGALGRGWELYYLQHHPGEKNIYPALGFKDLRVVNLPPAQQKWAYGRLDMVVGMMLHSGVLAFGAGVPTVSVAYDLRNHSFAEFISCPELVVDLPELSGGILAERVAEVWRRRGHYRRLFAIRRRQIALSQGKFLKSIKL